MSRKCQITGRGPRVGNKVSHSHRVSKRRWNINLQKIRVLIDGKVRRMKVSTKAIKSGLIEKPPIKIRMRKPKVIQPQIAEVVAAEDAIKEEAISEFFSDKTNVNRLFKPKQKPDAEDAENEIVDVELEDFSEESII